MTDCIFCKIINHEIPAEIVYEDGYVIAFLDAFPIVPGHTLVVPKEHCDNFLVMAPSTVRRVIDAVQAVSAQVKKGMQCDGLNVSTNVGKAAGQSVLHTHFHIMPRTANDGLKDWPNMKTNPDDIKKNASKIKSANGKVL